MMKTWHVLLLVLSIAAVSSAKAQELEITPRGPRFEWRHPGWGNRDWDREDYWRWRRHHHHWHHHYDEDYE